VWSAVSNEMPDESSKPSLEEPSKNKEESEKTDGTIPEIPTENMEIHHDGMCLQVVEHFVCM
jgi:hypothetical protein